MMLYGGFAFCNGDEICQILAATTLQSKTVVQFGKPVTLKPTSIDPSSFQDIVSTYFRKQGALKYVWLSPGEEIDGLQKHGSAGAFAYLMEDECTILAFPVV